MKKRMFGEKFFFPLILLLLPVVTYYPVFTHDFLYAWDDRWQVLNGHTLAGLSAGNLYAIFSEYVMGQYSPLNQLFYTLIYVFFGPDPTAFHAMNLLWHIGCVWLVYRFVYLLFRDRAGFTGARPFAFAVALLMAVHPVQVECVAWLSASKILTSVFFFLCGLIAYLAYVRNGRFYLYLLALAGFVCSFLCKEQAIVLPVVLVLLDWFMRRNLRRPEVWLEKVPFAMLAVCFLVITLDSYVLPYDRMFVGREVYPLLQRLAFTGYSLTEYITKLFFPVNLMYIYPYPIRAGEALPLRFWFYLPVLFVIASGIWAARKRPVLLFGCLFFLVELSLSLHIIPFPRMNIVADRYLYLALTGLLIAVAYELRQRSYSFLSGKKKWVVLGVLVLYFGIYTNYRCRTWKNDFTLKKEIKEFIRERKNVAGIEALNP